MGLLLFLHINAAIDSLVKEHAAFHEIFTRPHFVLEYCKLAFDVCLSLCRIPELMSAEMLVLCNSL